MLCLILLIEIRLTEEDVLEQLILVDTEPWNQFSGRLDILKRVYFN